MTDQSIFNNDGDGNPQPAPKGDEALNTLLASIKNEQGESKYDSVPKALEGLRNAQEYIPQLKSELSTKDQELEQLRSKVAELSAVNDVVDRLTAQPNTPEVETPPQPQGLDEQAIAKLIENTLNQRTQAQTAESNAAKVASALSEKFGTDAEKAYNDKASELGLEPSAMNALAKQSPEAVLALFGSVKKDPTPLAGGGLNTSGYVPAQETLVKRSDSEIMSGFYTTADLQSESAKSKQMVEELHAAGMDTWDLADPKNFAKYFGQI